MTERGNRTYRAAVALGRVGLRALDLEVRGTRLHHVPGLSRPMDAMRHVPVDRQAPAGAYVMARRLLRDGEAVCSFPEAGISYSYTVRSLMRGVAGTRPDLTRGRRADVSFGEPVTIGPGEDLVAWTCRLGALLTDQLEALQRLPHHLPQPGVVAPWYPAHLGGHAPTRAEAAHLDVVPQSAVRPTWGPG